MSISSQFRRARPAATVVAFALISCTDPGVERPTAPIPTKPSFAAGGSLGVNLDQCANAPRTQNCTWQNGDLNGSNSVYSEDLTVPFRLAIDGLTVDQVYVFHINYDFTAGGHKAYDFLASIDATEKVDKCAAGGGGTPLACTVPGGLAVVAEADFGGDGFGEPVNSPNFTVDGAINFSTFVDGSTERKLRLYGGSDLTVGAPAHVDSKGKILTDADLAGNTNADITVTFTARRSSVLFTWSGHLAQSTYWDGPTPDGAGQVNGAPWHMRTQQLLKQGETGAGNKNQDRSIQPSALITADANIQISTSGVNEVGTWHPMTGHVNINAGSGFVNAPDGTIISFAIATGPGFVTNNGSTTPLNPAQCATAGGTGSCTVYLYSTSAGLTTVNASTTVTVNGAPVVRSTNAVAPNSGPLTKQWVDAQIDLDPLTATNVLGQQHVITALVQQDDGLPAGAPGDGVAGFGSAVSKTVTFSLLNNTAGATFTTAAPFTCTTNASGQCTITITAANAGGVDIHATTTFSVGGVSLTRATGTGSFNSADAHKDYTAGSLAWTKVDGNSATLGGATFQYRLQGGSFVTVVDDIDGVTSAGDVDRDPDPGEFMISGLVIGTYDVKETSPPNNTYNIDPSTKTASITAQQPAAAVAVAFVNPKPRARIVLSPLTATNVLGEEHVVTATVSEDDGLAAPAGDNVNGYTPSASRMVTFSLLVNTAGVSFKNALSTCTTNASGQCTITLQSTQAGSVNIHATTTFTLGAVSLTATTGTGGDNSVDAQKTWSAGSISWTKVKGDGVTKLGNAVFEYRLQNSGNWIEVTDNNAPDADPDAGEFQILNLSLGTYEVREKTPPTGYNKDPDTEPVTITVQQSNASISTAFVDPQPKAKIVLSPLTATNEVNSAHVITATVSEDDGLAAGAPGDNASGYMPSAGRTVTFTLLNNSANAAFTTAPPFTCVTNASGQCTIAINTSTAGSVSIHATTTFALGTVSLTATTGTGGDNSADAAKVYVNAQIDLSPLTATNVLGEQHVITALVQQDDGLPAGAPGDGVAGFGPAVSKTVTFSLLNNTAGATFTTAAPFTCTTNASGQCTITITAANAGGVDIHATTTFSVGGVSLTRATGTGGLNSADANKAYLAGSLAWFKNDNNGARLGGATFQYRLSPDGAWISVTDNSSPDIDPDNGEFLIANLPVGTYDVQETQAPSGYTADLSVIKQGTITHSQPNAIISIAFVNTPVVTGKGCTPGFWKNKTSAWDSQSDALVAITGFSTSTLFNSYFGLSTATSPLKNTGTMLDAISLGGGGAQKLARHGVAALLNVAALGAEYQLPSGITTFAQLKVALTNAFLAKSYEPLATQLAASNDLDHSGCPQ